MRPAGRGRVAAVAVTAVVLAASCVAGGPLPDELAGMSQGDVAEGAEAQHMLAAMHGGPAAVPEQSVVATYFGPAGSAVVYLSVYAKAGDAADALQRMERAIGRGDTPFAPLRRSRDGVLRTRGLGQRHALWRAGPRLYWVQAPASVLELAVAELRGESGGGG